MASKTESKPRSVGEIKREAARIKRSLVRWRRQSEAVPGTRGALLRRKIDKGLSDCDALVKAATHSP